MTSARLRTLLEERATAWSAVQDIQARRERAGYESTEEDGESYTRSLADVERLSNEIETEERAERMSAVMNAPAPGQGDTNPTGEDRSGDEGRYATAFTAFLRGGMEAVTPEDRGLMQSRYEARAGAAGTPSAGGYTVPPGFLARMVETVKAYGGVLSLAEVLNTATGNDLQWPSNDDTGNVGAIVGENTQVTEQDTTFGNVELGAYMYTSKIIRLSLQLLQDSAFDLDAFVARKFGERIGRAGAAHFAAGTGTNQPLGVNTGTNILTSGAATTAITYDNLVDLEHKIDPALRERARYLVHDDVVKTVRKLKDSQGRPLWVPAMAGGVPSTINGRPYTVDNSLPALAAGSKSAVFGDFREAYVVRMVAGAQTLRLAERYADYLQVGFLGFQRMDGTIQNQSAIAVLHQAVTP
ncbi:phage major capsid protein [Promicromonospora thailandica]|uniref:Phage major capsid protein, HK97 family n=1 Tax=Promicromonospora thailandica TaxID=765201 RepID=A0A9X2G1Y8_9MICO|nr:phage major capsid protein [Promicromonospora thailandica]MCP2265567.1 phage major capsid protein, HK97 family [Promicromonospora thailandica]BFF17130.1 phage major capsid protein [Promicromonospora thailandica]